MKKSIISLMIVAGAAMSTSAVAQGFTPSLPGGDITLGGTITTAMEGVYEGKVSSLNGLNATIRVGESEATITAPNHAGLLALRSIDGFDNTAHGRIANIKFDGKSLSDAAGGGRFTNGKIDLSLIVKNSENAEIGTVVVPVQVAAVSVTVDKHTKEASGESLSAIEDQYAFFGGLPYSPGASIQSYDGALGVVNSLFSDITAGFPEATLKATSAVAKSFGAADKTFYTAYAAGVTQGDTIHLTLNNPAANAGDVSWTASMPITVTYK
ncbi:TPA: hypothetical protein ACWCES_004856 [Escherichia coli]